MGREECTVDEEDEGIYHFTLEHTVLQDVSLSRQLFWLPFPKYLLISTISVSEMMDF